MNQPNNDPGYSEWSDELWYQAQVEMDSLIFPDELMLEQLDREDNDT